MVVVHAVHMTWCVLAVIETVCVPAVHRTWGAFGVHMTRSCCTHDRDVPAVHMTWGEVLSKPLMQGGQLHLLAVQGGRQVGEGAWPEGHHGSRQLA